MTVYTSRQCHGFAKMLAWLWMGDAQPQHKEIHKGYTIRLVLVAGGTTHPGVGTT
jgi:hypothetical protein